MTTDDPGQRTLRGVALPLALLTVSHALIAGANTVVPVIAPAMARDLGIDPAQVGFYSSLIFAGAMVATLCGSSFVRRYGAIRSNQLSLVVCAAGLGVTALSGSLLPVALCALVIGAGAGFPTPAGSHLLSRLSPRRSMSLVFSVKQAGVPVGGVAVGAALPTIAVLFGWRWAVLAAALACVLVLLVGQIWRERYDADREPGFGLFSAGLFGPLRLVLGRPDMRALALASIAFVSVHACLNAFLVTYLTESVGLTLVVAGVAFAWAQVGGVFGRVFWGVVADALGNSRLLLGFLGFAMAALTVAVAAVDVTWPLWAIILLCAAKGSLCMGWTGVHLAEVARLAPEGEAARATSGSAFLTYTGIVLAPSAFSVILLATGSFDAAFWMIAAGAVAAGAALLPGALRIRRERGTAKPG